MSGAAGVRPTRRRTAAATYLGRPCKHGHSGERYIKGGNCVACSRTSAAAAYVRRRPPPRTRKEQRAIHYGTIADRFHRKWIGEPNSGCWLWLGSIDRKGYGQIRDPDQNRLRVATHVSIELHGGAVPPGMCVLHRCDVPGCVNPAHLFVGTLKDNTQDMIGKKRNSPPPKTKPGQGAKLVCLRGHVRTIAATGKRVCLECKKAQKALRRAAFKASGLRSDGLPHQQACP